jgi:hypothetical protein
MTAIVTPHRFWSPLRLTGWGFALALWLTPLVAMQFVADWNWGPGDFLVAAILIGGVGLGVEWVVRRSADVNFRLAAALALIATFFLLWGNAAVHLVADRDYPTNMLVLLIPLMGFVLGWRARWQPLRLSRALLAMAAAQAALAVFVLATSNFKHAVVLALFVMPWLASAYLFRRAASAVG